MTIMQQLDISTKYLGCSPYTVQSVHIESTPSVYQARINPFAVSPLKEASPGKSVKALNLWPKMKFSAKDSVP